MVCVGRVVLGKVTMNFLNVHLNHFDSLIFKISGDFIKLFLLNGWLIVHIV